MKDGGWSTPLVLLPVFGGSLENSVPSNSDPCGPGIGVSPVCKHL